MNRPLLAITMGDPAGVGPEVIAGAWADPLVHELARPLAVGHPELLRQAVELLKLPIAVQEIASPDEAEPTPRVMPCLRAVRDDVLQVRRCEIDPRGGQAAYDALVWAARRALAGEIDGLVTAPLHKAALWQAGHHYPGHTELLAELCGVDDFAMMLYLGHDDVIRGSAGLGVVHVTLHIALRQICEQLSTEAIVAKIHLADRVMRGLKQGGSPRVAVAALNPHAGEEGLFGDEERTVIAPAVVAARAAGIDAHGPIATDTLMGRARDGEFDAVVAMYHDQGHIALKLLGMHRAVNVTLGLPVVRTSVAHGTAFDRAWRGTAEISSMVEAIRVAALLANQRRRGAVSER